MTVDADRALIEALRAEALTDLLNAAVSALEAAIARAEAAEDERDRMRLGYADKARMPLSTRELIVRAEEAERQLGLARMAREREVERLQNGIGLWQEECRKCKDRAVLAERRVRELEEALETIEQELAPAGPGAVRVHVALAKTRAVLGGLPE